MKYCENIRRNLSYRVIQTIKFAAQLLNEFLHYTSGTTDSPGNASYHKILVAVKGHRVQCQTCKCPFMNFLGLYGEVQCYSSQRCRARIIAGDKHLSKNILDADLTVYNVSKYLCVDMAICNIQKYFVLI
jgi:hypothetical protein